MDINNQAGVDSSFTLMDLNKRYLESNDIDKSIDLNDLETINKFKEDEDLGYEMLLDSNPTKIKLRHNCRNTRQIIKDTQLNTGADIGIAKIKGDGLHPFYAEVSSKEETVSELEAALNEWSNEVSLNDIVILSTVDYAKSSAAYLSQKWQDKIQILTKDNVLNQNPRKILFSDISSYKGLDKPIVIVIDIEKTMEAMTKDQQEDKDFVIKSIESFLYVAMTRSNSILWITVSPEFGNFLKEQQKINIQKMTKN
jgi:superfamily I DNA/RNA helicase